MDLLFIFQCTLATKVANSTLKTSDITVAVDGDANANTAITKAFRIYVFGRLLKLVFGRLSLHADEKIGGLIINTFSRQ